MCGIVGVHGRQEDSWIEAMNRLIHHRGPDDDGIFRHREVDLALAMRRLSILDLEGGAQPMSTSDGRYTIVYNGEIYNAPELRQSLEQRGERFSTDHSDTEVLLRLLARDGVATLTRLNGMFAFIFYDRAAGTLTCARDRFGIKPLYYVETAGRLAIASEAKALLALPFVDKSLNFDSLHHYMSLMYVPDPASIFAGVNRLPAGHVLTYELASRKIGIAPWWHHSFSRESVKEPSEWSERLRGSFRAAVRRWSLADVPIACSLSGGLDSSAIVGALSEAGVRVKTYALGFTGPDEAGWNELPRARTVATHWATDHHELVLSPETLLDDLIKMVWHLDEPYGGGLPSWSVFKFMSADVKVGLTGTGGDELFGNYGKWRPFEGSMFPFGNLVYRPKADAEAFERKFFETSYYATEREKRSNILLRTPSQSTSDLLYRHFAAAGVHNLRDRVALTDIETQLSEEFLLMTDRFSMAHSLEARTPFLDAEFSELALSIPASLRTQRRDLKGLLRRAVEPLLPSEILHLPKQGFVLPLKIWLRGQLRRLAEMLLAPARLKSQGVFKPEFYDMYVRPHLDARADHTNKVWAAVMFQLWHLIFIERSGPPDFALRDIST